MAIATCPKCLGKGRVDAFNHISGGTCFRCHGRGEIVVPVSDFVKEVKNHDVYVKVRWLIKASDKTITSIPFEKLEDIRKWCRSETAARFDFVFGLWLKRFEGVYQAKQQEKFESMVKPF
jgi:hypothetical protein